MRLLLDTHVVLWWRQANARLGAEAVGAISQADVVYVSAASAWEVAIKRALGKIRLPGRFTDGVAASGFLPLPIGLAHAEAAGELPPHHADPFDRMLVAQARLERLTVVTHDRSFAPYGGAVLWV
ncbi:MAG TPA: type II toxin-antitoxin system VapC family toxin [Gemmatimonadales bacterium]|nr:type II toxin-antitoxin system VapC family toxin [Gemmatimonadales bacterium]